MSKKKFFLVLTITVVILNIVIVLPRLIKYNGMLLENIGEYNGYHYAHGAGTSYGLFRKSDDSNEYVNISKYAPLDAKFVFFQGAEAVYSTRGYSLVRINLTTLEEKILKVDTMSFLIVALNRNYIVAEDVDNGSAVTILDIETFDIVEVIEINPKNIKIDELSIEFTDSNSDDEYRYYFERRYLEKIQ